MELVEASSQVSRDGLQTTEWKYVFPDQNTASNFAKGYVQAKIDQDESGRYVVSATEHSVAAGAPGQPPQVSELVHEELVVTMKQEPIESHPFFLGGKGRPGLHDIYGYDDAAKQFGELLPGSTQSNIQNPKAAVSQKNPLYGTRSFLCPSVIYTKSRTVLSLYSIPGLFTNIGAIQTPITQNMKLENVMGARGQTRNWLKLAPKVVTQEGKKGSLVFQVTEQWQLSGPNGWNPILYKVASA